MNIVTALRGIGRAFIGGYRSRSRRAGKSKYMPHLGAKERARHAGKPDGRMDQSPAWLKLNAEMNASDARAAR